VVEALEAPEKAAIEAREVTNVKELADKLVSLEERLGDLTFQNQQIQLELAEVVENNKVLIEENAQLVEFFKNQESSIKSKINNDASGVVQAEAIEAIKAIKTAGEQTRTQLKDLIINANKRNMAEIKTKKIDTALRAANCIVLLFVLAAVVCRVI
jgi:regulator of replication initiation timing